MSAVAEIRAAQARTLVDEDGDEVPLDLGPPATEDEIAALERRVGLREVFRQLTPPHESLIDVVHDDRAFDVWGSDHGALAHEDAVAAGGELEAFARSLDHREYLIYDLRHATPGEGFAWGRAGPHADVHRHGHQRIFAVDQRRPTGRLKRLFGR